MVKVDKAAANPGWNDYLNSGLALPRTSANAPTIKTFRGNIDQAAFTGTGGVINETWVNAHILHDYKSGTKLYPHIHWSHNNATPSGDVKWILEYSVAKSHSQGVFPAATTINLIQAAGPQYTHQLIEVSEGDAIDATDLEPDTVIQFRVYRDPTDGEDTFGDDAFLIYFDCHVEIDGRMTNEKANPFTKRG